MLFKGIHRLPSQCHPIRQKQFPFGTITTHQQISKRNDSACLAGTGCHHYQGLALVVHFDGFGYPAHGAGLIITLDNISINDGICQRLVAGTALN